MNETCPYPGGKAPPTAPRFDSIALCGSCGLGVAHPRPSQTTLDTYYASGAYWHASGGSVAQIAHERNQARHRVLRCLAHGAWRGPVADIGAGHGAIAEWLNILAGDRVGRYDFIEPDIANKAGILSRRRACFPVTAASEISELGRDYALIFLSQVLEHVADPVTFLGDVCDRLRPGGIVYVETPHADHRFKDDVFPHTLFFTPTALMELARRLDVEVLECTTFGAYPGAPGGVGPGQFRWLSRAFHVVAHASTIAAERWLDDLIWRYQPRPNGMWLRCILRRRSGSLQP